MFLDVGKIRGLIPRWSAEGYGDPNGQEYLPMAIREMSLKIDRFWASMALSQVRSRRQAWYRRPSGLNVLWSDWLLRRGSWTFSPFQRRVIATDTLKICASGDGDNR